MGKIATASVLLATLIAACTGCSTAKPAPGHPPAAPTRAPVAGAAKAPATRTPAAAAPAAPAEHGQRAHHRRAHLVAAPVPYGVTCQPAALRLALGQRLSQATSQETLVLTLTNISAAGCDLDGYPGVSLLTRSGLALPFGVHWGGSQMLTTSAPVLVPLAPGGTAYFGITKWACVGHSPAVARTFQVIPPDDYQPVSLTTARYPVVYYCPASDPGHTVNVTPVEPSLRGIFSQRLLRG